MGNDWGVSAIAIGAAALIGWSGVGGRSHRPAGPAAIDSVDRRVVAIAQAIAVAEGYYAPGTHDGRSLPYRLNKPGGLKKPALGAGSLPTWKDTGIVQFPTSEMGWAALHYQVRAMASGTSTVYQPSDTLETVGGKYADGDLNWGVNVAAALGVTPAAKVADLVGRR